MSRRLQLVLVPLRSTEELAMMMESFRSCIAAMFWSLVLLLFLVYMSYLGRQRIHRNEVESR